MMTNGVEMRVRWTIGKKLASVGVVLVVALSITGASALQSLASQERHLDEVIDLSEARSEFQDGTFNAAEMRVEAQSALAASEPEAIEHARTAFEDQAAQFAEHLEAAEQHHLPASILEEVEHLLALESGVVSSYEAVIDAHAEGHDSAEQLAAADEAYDELLTGTEVVHDELEELVHDADESAAAAATSARSTFTASAAIALLITLALLVWNARNIRRSLRNAERAVTALGRGDLTSVATAKGTDELADMVRTIEQTRQALSTSLTTVVSGAGAIDTSSLELMQVATEVAGAAEETAVQSNVVAAASEQISGNLQSISAAVDEMSASVDDIARSTSTASSVAAEAIGHATSVAGVIGSLDTRSTEISAVIQMIRSIAEQTNLLALNATIEAARAGEAGKGFAVVAHEVKELASEAGTASEDIEARVMAIQQDAQQAVGAVQSIVEIIESINDHQGQIAAAVEEQAATTSEIARAVSEAATGSGEVARNITGVAAASQQTSGGMTQAKSAADDLAHTAGELREAIAGFTI